MEYHAQGVDVRAMIGVGRVLALLGRHVKRCPHGGAGQGQIEIAGADVTVQELDQTEVRQFDRSIFRKENVGRFEIAVNHALLVGVLQRETELEKDFDRLRGSEPPSLQEVVEIRPIHVVHDGKDSRAGRKTPNDLLGRGNG